MTAYCLVLLRGVSFWSKNKNNNFGAISFLFVDEKITNKSHHGPLHDIDLQEQEEDSQQQNPLTKPTVTHLNKGTSVTVSPNGVGFGEQ